MAANDRYDISTYRYVINRKNQPDTVVAGVEKKDLEREILKSTFRSPLASVSSLTVNKRDYSKNFVVVLFSERPSISCTGEKDEFGLVTVEYRSSTPEVEQPRAGKRVFTIHVDIPATGFTSNKFGPLVANVSTSIQGALFEVGFVGRASLVRNIRSVILNFGQIFRLNTIRGKEGSFSDSDVEINIPKYIEVNYRTKDPLFKNHNVGKREFRHYVVTFNDVVIEPSGFIAIVEKRHIPGLAFVRYSEHLLPQYERDGILAQLIMGILSLIDKHINSFFLLLTDWYSLKQENPSLFLSLVGQRLGFFRPLLSTEEHFGFRGSAPAGGQTFGQAPFYNIEREHFSNQVPMNDQFYRKCLQSRIAMLLHGGTTRGLHLALESFFTPDQISIRSTYLGRHIWIIISAPEYDFFVFFRYRHAFISPTFGIQYHFFHRNQQNAPILMSHTIFGSLPTPVVTLAKRDFSKSFGVIFPRIAQAGNALPITPIRIIFFRLQETHGGRFVLVEVTKVLSKGVNIEAEQTGIAARDPWVWPLADFQNFWFIQAYLYHEVQTSVTVSATKRLLNE